jgi:hypothetical protein
MKMLPQRISAKFFINEPDAVDLPAFIPVFHNWIREQKVDGVPIDVADYKHVKEGPGVLLIGHEGDYALDLGHGRPGLLYSYKREWQSETLAGRLQAVLHRLLRGAQLVETEASLDGRITFGTDELQLTFLDRLRTPNTPETLAAVGHEVEAALAAVYGDLAASVERVETDERRPFSLQVQIPEAPAVNTLLNRLNQQLAVTV